MKHSIKTKILCSLLSVLLVMQIVPFSSLAIEDTNSGVWSEAQTEVTSEAIPDILYEVVDERDEYTKVYLLEDGSFCSIASPTPIHTFADGIWVDVYSELEENRGIRTVDEAVENIQSSATSTYSLQRSNVSQQEDSAMIFNTLDCIEMPGGGYMFGDACGIFMKPINVGDYINKNRLIIYAGLSVNCTFDENEENLVYVYEENFEWSENSVPEDYGEEGLKVADVINLTTPGNNIWEITDLYSRWDSGATDNNGVYMYNYSESELIISNPYIVVRYIEVDNNDLDFTYHSLDMGAAGALYINDCTNAIRIEQNLLEFPNASSGVSLNRSYNSMLPLYTNYAGIGFTFNLESSIELTQYYANWTMVNGTTMRFVATNPVVTEGDYQLWIPVNDINSENNVTELWVKNSEINNLNNYSNIIDYRNVYIISNGYKNEFEQSGKLSAVLDVSSDNTILSIEYNNGRISEIVNSDRTKMVFSYEKSNIGYTYVTNIAVKTESGANVMSTDGQALDVDISTIYNSSSKTTTQTIKFSNGDEVKYVFDFDGNLISVLDENENYYTIDYKVQSDGYTGNRIVGYGKYYPENTSYNNSSTANPDESLYIDSEDTYQREFTNEKEEKELIHYDRNYNIIVYRDSHGTYTCAEYDINNLIASYTFGKPENELILNGTFDTDGTSIPNWKKEGKNIKKVVGANDNDKVIRMASTEEFTSSLYQDIVVSDADNAPKIIFEADKTYVIGGYGKAENVIPKDDRFFGIKVEAAPIVNGDISTITDSDYNECFSLAFDTCTQNEWQFRMASFKLETESVLRVRLLCENQTNTMYFNDIVLYESKDSKSDLEGVVTSSPIVYSYNDDGSINSETMIWTQESGNNISMGTSYIYENNKLSEYKDINNNSTYYNYNPDTSMLSEIGHIKDENGDLLDATSVVYEAESLLKSTSTVINSVVPVNTTSSETEGDTDGENQLSQYIISTDYDIASEGIVGVTHNGVKYCFEYNNDGTLKSVHAEQVLSEDDTTSSIEEINSAYSTNGYRVDYTYNTDGDISVIDYSNNYRVKHISSINENGEKTVNIQCYSTNDDSTDKELIKSYAYDFDSSGILSSVYDSGTGITITYSNDGYVISDDAVLYQRINEDGKTIEYYTQAQYNELNNTDEDMVTTSPSTVSYDENNIKTSTSTVSIHKNVNNFMSIFNYSRSSVVDYFNRIENKETSHEYTRPIVDHEGNIIGVDSGTVSVNTDYEYQMLDDGKTSGLISEYTSTIIGSPRARSTEQPEPLIYNRKYEYDKKGNVTFVYTESNGVISPKNFYEYDNANQLVTEIIFDSEDGLVAHYTYNAGGNLTAKIYYNYSNLMFDITNRKIIELGDEESRITYCYDTVWTDRLVSYNGTEIVYDKMGNPLNYVGKDYCDNDITGTLTWSGNLLTSFETGNARYIYQYDANGYRTSKTQFELNDNYTSEADKWKKVYTFNYIWDNGVLTGYLLSSVNDDGTINEEQNFNLIYDEEGAPVGYVTMYGVPYYFCKDINENVLSLVYTDGSETCSYTYDSWGLPIVTLHGTIAEKIATALTVPFCPATYHGYLYDYETGLYFNQGRYYSPSWGRYLNPEDAVKLTENSTNPLDANLYLFCNNNTVNNLDKTASWSRNYTGVTWTANGFDVEMSKIFSSRAFCSVFAGQIIKTYGSWDLVNGFNYQGMNSIRIASDLFAHCIGKYAQSAINKVNTCWGDGWILNNSKSNTICIRNDDENAWKYEKIWFAASALKAYAQRDGIYIIL